MTDLHSATEGSGPLAIIRDPAADEDALRQAIMDIAGSDVPSEIWAKIANDPAYRVAHRRLCIFELFRRHVRAGMKASELARLLHGALWLDDRDVRLVEDVSGWLPVKMTFEDTVFELRILPNREGPSEFFAIYLRMAGLVPRTAFVSLLRGEEVDAPLADATILEIGFVPPVDDWSFLRVKSQP
jgi:hypothetical protein